MKRLLLAAAVVLVVSPAIAEDAPKAPPQKIYLEFDQQDLNILSAAINNGLVKAVADPFLVKINTMIGQQPQIVERAAATVKPAAQAQGAPEDKK